MAKVEIYSSMFCGHSGRAKRLLREKGVAFEDYDVMADRERRAEMTARASGRTSVPQIFIDGMHIGGSQDLHDLEAAGELDRLLADAPGAAQP